MRRWERVEAFIAVVQRGGFTAAADALGVSPSHISRLVSDLEAELGVTLLFRTTRTTRLSEAGQQYFSECEHLLQNFSHAEERLTEQLSEPSGVLKITCSTTFGERFIAPLLPAFLKQYPKLQVDLHLSNTRVDLIRDGFDLAIRLGTMKDSSLLARRLCERTEYVCASPAYFEAHGVPHTLNELQDHNCLEGTSSTWLFQENNHRREWRIKGNWKSNSGPAVLEAVKQGLGIAQLPDYYVKPLLDSGELISILNQYRYPLSGVWLVYPKARQQVPRLKLLCDYLISSFEQAKGLTS